MDQYICLCDYIYIPEIGDPKNGINPGTKFLDLPDNWNCPNCGYCNKDDFVIVKTNDKITDNHMYYEGIKKKKNKGVNNPKNSKLFILTIILSVLFLFHIVSIFLFLNMYDYYFKSIIRKDDPIPIVTKFVAPFKKIGRLIKKYKKHDIYVLKKNETLYDVSKKFGIHLYTLRYYNEEIGNLIKNLKQGSKIYIPFYLSRIKIDSTKLKGKAPLNIKFKILTETRGLIERYNWNFGNGDKSNKKCPDYLFKEKGIYEVNVTVITFFHNEIQSNILTIYVE